MPLPFKCWITGVSYQAWHLFSNKNIWVAVSDVHLLNQQINREKALSLELLDYLYILILVV